MSISGVQASVPYDGLTLSLTGLYQFNVVVPRGGANAANPVTFLLGGTKGTQSLLIATQKLKGRIIAIMCMRIGD